MIIAHLTFETTTANVKDALSTIVAHCDRVQGMKGCAAFIPFQDAQNDRRIGIVHEWDHADAFEAYLASDVFKDMGQRLRPLMEGPPVSRRFDAQLLDG